MIAAIVALADTLEGDTDIEGEDERECDELELNEPSLGWNRLRDQSDLGCADGCDPDREYEHDGREPDGEDQVDDHPIDEPEFDSGGLIVGGNERAGTHSMVGGAQ